MYIMKINKAFLSFGLFLSFYGFFLGAMNSEYEEIPEYDFVVDKLKYILLIQRNCIARMKLILIKRNECEKLINLKRLNLYDEYCEIMENMRVERKNDPNFQDIIQNGYPREIIKKMQADSWDCYDNLLASLNVIIDAKIKAIEEEYKRLEALLNKFI